MRREILKRDKWNIFFNQWHTFFNQQCFLQFYWNFFFISFVAEIEDKKNCTIKNIFFFKFDGFTRKKIYKLGA